LIDKRGIFFDWRKVGFKTTKRTKKCKKKKKKKKKKG